MVVKGGLGALTETEAVIIVPKSLAIDTVVAKAGLSTVLSSQSISKVCFPATNNWGQF